MNLLGRLLARGHSADDEAGAVSGVATDEDVGGVLWVLWLQEAHSQQAEFSLDDFGLPFLDHDGTSAVGVGLPIDFLHLDACQLAISYLWLLCTSLSAWLADFLRQDSMPASKLFCCESSPEGEAKPLCPRPRGGVITGG